MLIFHNVSILTLLYCACVRGVIKIIYIAEVHASFSFAKLFSSLLQQDFSGAFIL